MRILEKRREIIGDYQFRCTFRYAGMPLDEAEKSMRLFAKEVLPVLKSWTYEPKKAAAETTETEAKAPAKKAPAKKAAAKADKE